LRVRAKTLTLLEYDSIRYGIVDNKREEGLDVDSEKEGDNKNNKLFITEKSLKQLEKLNETQKFMEIYRDRLKALNYVGVVRVGTINIEILPKFLTGEIDEIKPTIMTNLLVMLRYTRRLNVKETDIARLDLKNDFFEIFVHLFSKRLLNLLKLKQDRGYIRRNEELKFVRERIEIKKYGNPARLHKIPCIFHERLMDTPINRTLKYTCYLLLKLVKSEDNYRLLKQIVSILTPTKLTPVSVDFASRISFNRLNSDFKPFIDVCIQFLKGFSLTLQASNVEFFSLMIPMEKLFEEFIAGILKEEFHDFLGGKPISQRDVGFLAKREGREEFKLVPDIVIEKDGKSKYLIDTKYKLLDQDDRKLGVSHLDLYQMHAYAAKTKAEKMLLLYPRYPQTEMPETKWEFEFESWRTELFVRTIDLSYDLRKERDWDRFTNELARVLDCLRPKGWEESYV